MNDAVNAWKLAGMVAIVSGAGSRGPGIGIGRATATLFAEAGAHVALLDSNRENLLETEDLVKRTGAEYLSLVVDATDPEQCEAAVAAVSVHFGRVDILANIVGTSGPAGDVVDVDLDAWRACLEVNVTSVVNMSRAAIPRMTAAGGVITNTASGAALAGGHPWIGYSTSKGALVNMTRAMAATHGPDGIRVNLVAPGYVHTPMAVGVGVDDAQRERRRLASPLQTEGTGWDVAQAIRFLSSPLARWITGVVLPVDAGLTSFVPSLGNAAPTVKADS